eukprot:TRINITY_DN2330_c0_g1_i4.p1 TRINITY_DN2330_c0_g1~~TRINITY_DN2330_c0_g1_i4.p1  ORF type:complete len:389 (+),score=79.52 TRINITY_DN2330_c0_g1_i4:472-1638(+)
MLHVKILQQALMNEEGVFLRVDQWLANHQYVEKIVHQFITSQEPETFVNISELLQKVLTCFVEGPLAPLALPPEFAGLMGLGLGGPSLAALLRGLNNGNNNTNHQHPSGRSSQYFGRSKIVAALLSPTTMASLLDSLAPADDGPDEVVGRRREEAFSSLSNLLSKVSSVLVDGSASLDLIESVKTLYLSLSLKLDPFVNLLVSDNSDQKVGFHRLKIVEFIRSFVETGSETVQTKLLDINFYNICLKIFFECESNNIFQNVVVGLFSHIFSKCSDDIQLRVIANTELIEKIVETFRGLDESEGRLYAGHLQQIGETVLAASSTSHLVCEALEKTSWKEVADEIQARKEKLRIPLCSYKPEVLQTHNTNGPSVESWSELNLMKPRNDMQ